MQPRMAFTAGLAIVLTSVCGMAPAWAEKVVFARQLALSPNGETLAFSWAGDIWTVSASGGSARRLTVNPARESHPTWSRDGELITFSSDRHGAPNVFVMTAEGTEIRRLTFSDNAEIPSDFSPDGEFVYYHSRKTGDTNWEPRLYRVPTVGGQSLPVMKAFGSCAKVSPDGRYLAFTRGVSKPWRTGYRGSANWDVWLRDLESGSFTHLTDFDGTDMMPVWDTQGAGVYFLSDRVDTHNVWYRPLNGANVRQITHATDDRVRDFALSGDGKKLAYTQWDKIYVLTLPHGSPQEIEVTAASDSARNGVELKSLTSDASEVEASPDGKEVALVVRGEIFVIKTEPDKPTRRVTESAARDWHVTWSPDGKALFFVSDREGQEDIYRAISGEEPSKALSDSLRFKIERVTVSPEVERSPQVSPDGTKLSFVRGRGDACIRDLKTGEERLLFAGWNDPRIRWSPDSKWIAYAVEDEEYNPDVWIVPADPESDAQAVNISQHPDYDGNPQWSADGQVLAFASARAGFDNDLYMVFLSPELNEKSQVDIDEYFKDAGEKAKKRKPIKEAVASGEITLGTPPETATQPGEPAEGDEVAAEEEEAGDGAEAKAGEEEEPSIEERLRTLLKEFLEGPKKEDRKKADEKEEKAEEAQKYEYKLETAYKRIRRVTSLPADQTGFALAPAGDLIVFNSSHEGKPALFSVKWNGEDRKRILSGAVGGLHWTLDGTRLFYRRSGAPGSCTASGGDSKTHSFRGKMAIDHREEAQQKFDDAARALGRTFYHPTLKELDWSGLTAKYRELALHTHTYAEFNEIFSFLQGLLNGSHLGIFGPHGGEQSERVGYLGCEIDADYRGPGVKIAHITPRSPADRDESKLYPGDVLVRVNGRPVGPESSLDQALIDTVGEQIFVEYIPSPAREPAAEQVEAAETTEAQGKPEPEVEAKPESVAGEADSAQTEAAADEPRTEELVIRPISYQAFEGLRYDEWVETNRRYVDQQSNGRVAYTHIAGMGESQFHVFERDLYAAANGKDGLIIDVRNNGGGWTADWVMAVLNVRRHAYTVGRGGKPGYPQDRLIFYAWTKPATMMCNQCSYSNAEIVSHAFKNLGRGPLVGTTTFGAVISTGGYRLIDGTIVRMPFRGWYTLPDGVDMENNGAVPTVPIDRTPTDEEQGRFPQLDAAVRATLQQIEQEAASNVARQEVVRVEKAGS